MKHSLCRVELRDGREDTTGIAGKENNVGRVVFRQTRDLGVIDVFDGVGAASVLSKCRVIVINQTGFRAEDDVLKNRTKFDCAEDIRLFLS